MLMTNTWSHKNINFNTNSNVFNNIFFKSHMALILTVHKIMGKIYIIVFWAL